MVAAPVAGSPAPAKDAIVDRSLEFIFFDEDPVDKFNRPGMGLLARRNLLLGLAMRCSAYTRGVGSIAADIAASDLVFSPTQTNPSTSSLMEAASRMDMVNNSMRRLGGHKDWIINYCRAFFASKTGVFIYLPRTEFGDVEMISMIQPNLPMPYYGVLDDGTLNISTAPRMSIPGMIMPPVIEYPEARGVWWREEEVFNSGRYYMAPEYHYVQVCYGAFGHGAFQDCIPPAEDMISELVAYTAINDHMRRTYNLTDDAQVMTLDNADNQDVRAQMGQIREIRARQRRGETIDDKEKGLRVVINNSDPDRQVKAAVVDLRAFPTDYNGLEMMGALSQIIAKHLGINPQRVAPMMSRDRTDSAAVSALQQSNEPGMKMCQQTIEQFFSNYVLAGLDMKAKLSNSTPDNHAKLTADLLAAQVTSQMGDQVPADWKINYLIRNNVLLPADRGQADTAEQLSDGSTQTKRIKQLGWTGMAWPDGRPITRDDIHAMPITLDGWRINRRKAVDPPPSPVQDDADIEEMDALIRVRIEAALARWRDWMQNDLPTCVDQYGLDQAELRRECSQIASEIGQLIMRLAQLLAGRDKSPALKLYYDTLLSGWLNRIAPLEERPITLYPASNNMYRDMSMLAIRFITMTATIGDLQTIAARYMEDIPRYFTATSAAWFMKRYGDYDGSVTWWVDHTAQNCNDCLAFEGSYESIAAMLAVTGGRWPRDITLLCAGRCHCRIHGGTP